MVSPVYATGIFLTIFHGRPTPSGPVRRRSCSVGRGSQFGGCAGCSRRTLEEDESLTIGEAAMAASCLSALGGPSHEPLDPPEPNRYALIGAQSTRR